MSTFTSLHPEDACGPLAYTLTKLAELSGLPERDILIFEKNGKIKSCRSTSGRRIFAHAEVAFLLGEERS